MKNFQIMLMIGVILSSVSLIFFITAIPILCCRWNDEKLSWYQAGYMKYLLDKDNKSTVEKNYVAAYVLHIISFLLAIVAVTLAGVALCTSMGENCAYMVTTVALAGTACLFILTTFAIHASKPMRDQRSDLLQIIEEHAEDKRSRRSSIFMTEGHDNPAYVGQQSYSEFMDGDDGDYSHRFGDDDDDDFGGGGGGGGSSSGGSSDDEAKAWDIRTAMLALAFLLFTGGMVCMIVALAMIC